MIRDTYAKAKLMWFNSHSFSFLMLACARAKTCRRFCFVRPILNDLNSFLARDDVHGSSLLLSGLRIYVLLILSYVHLFILLYTAYTVRLAERAEYMQNSLYICLL